MDRERLSVWMLRVSVSAALFGAIQFITLLVTFLFIKPLADVWQRHFPALDLLRNAVHAFAGRFDGGFDNSHESSVVLVYLAGVALIFALSALWHRERHGIAPRVVSALGCAALSGLVVFLVGLQIDGAVQSFLCRCIV